METYIFTLGYCCLAVFHNSHKFNLEIVFAVLSVKTRHIEAFATCLTYKTTTFCTGDIDIEVVKVIIVVIAPRQAEIAVGSCHIAFNLDIAYRYGGRIIVCREYCDFAKFQLIIVVGGRGIYGYGNFIDGGSVEQSEIIFSHSPAIHSVLLCGCKSCAAETELGLCAIALIDKATETTVFHSNLAIEKVPCCSA